MKTFSIISYIIGSILLIASCFTTGVALTWVLGGLAVVFLVIGCVFQYNTTKQRRYEEPRERRHEESRYN